MTMEAREAGFESTLYLNSASFGSPAWVEIDLARDLTDAKDVAQLDATSRGIARRGFQAAQAGTTPWGFDFDCLVPAAGQTNAAYTALMTALKARSNVDILHVEGGDISVDALTAERGVCCVTGGGKGETMGDMSTRSFVVRFTPNANQNAPQDGVTADGEFVTAS